MTKDGFTQLIHSTLEKTLSSPVDAVGEHSDAGWVGRSANGEGRVGVMAVIWNNPPRIPSIGGRGARGRGQDAHGAN